MRALKIRSIFIIMLTLLLVAIQGCASTRKNPWAEKRKKASHVNTTQLGRNRYYFSVNYQKKLQRSLKKK